MRREIMAVASHPVVSFKHFTTCACFLLKCNFNSHQLVLLLMKLPKLIILNDYMAERMYLEMYILFKNLSVVCLEINVFMSYAFECWSMSVLRSSNTSLCAESYRSWEKFFAEIANFSCIFSLFTKLSLLYVVASQRELGFCWQFYHCSLVAQNHLSWKELPGAFFSLWFCLVIHEGYSMWNLHVRCKEVILDTFWKLEWDPPCLVLLSQNTWALVTYNEQALMNSQFSRLGNPKPNCQHLTMGFCLQGVGKFSFYLYHHHHYHFVFFVVAEMGSHSVALASLELVM